MILALLALVALVAVVFALRFRREAVRAQAGEHRLHELARLSPDLTIALIDREQRIVFFEGPAVLERSEDMVGRILTEAIPNERAQELAGLVDSALEGNTSRIFWDQIRDGRDFRVDVVPYSERGAITHAAVVLRDITVGRSLKRTLEHQQTFLAAVLSQLGDRVRVADADGHLLTFTGDHPAADLHPLEWAEHFGLHHPDGRPLGPHETPLLRALRGEAVEGVEVRVDGAEGRRSVLESGGPVLGPDGERLGAVTVTTDLTAYRDAEGRLRRSEERHRRVVESVSDCVFETDAQGRWIHLSEAWESATGFTVEESLGRRVWEFVHPDDRAAHAKAFAPLMGGERAALRHCHRFLTGAGAERWGEVQVRAISGWDGLPTGFVGVMSDITEEYRARQHAAAEQKIMRHLTQIRGLEVAGPGFIEVLGTELGWDGAELWRMDDDERIRRFATWQAPGVDFERFLAAGEDLAYEVGDGFPGLAWMSREPLWHAEITGQSIFRRLDEALDGGMRSTVALPLRYGNDPVAVIVLMSRTPREPEPGLLRLLEALSGQVTQFVQRREADALAIGQAEDLRRLSEVAHELAAQTDSFAARNTLCQAVRDVTDASSVTLWEPSGEALMVSAAVGAAVRGCVVELDVREPAAAAFLTCELGFDAAVGGSDVAGSASVAWLPITRDHHCVGVLAVGWSAVRHSLTSREEELLRLLATEAAITIDRTDLLARLQSTARTDALTGLPNRRVWDEDLERELARAQRHGGSLCLAMLDLDRFKAYNDQYGHQAGDELLAMTATAWRPELRSTDTIARYGGEEFAVLLPHSDEEGAYAVIERLLAAVPHGQTASAGIALWDGSETAAELLARADAALYAAKGAGRARALIAS